MFKLKRVVCIACSSGGHYTEALRATSALREEFAYFFVTAKTGRSTSTKSHFFVIDPHLNFAKYIINAFQSLTIFIQNRPRVIVSTGAGITIPICVLGKILGSKIVFVESGARITAPSRTGRLISKFADEVYVQWEENLAYYPDAKLGGVLF